MTSKYIFFYIFYNILNVFIIYKSIKIILNNELVFNRKYEIMSYVSYFLISTIIFLLIRIPIIMLFSNMLMLLLIQFNYKTTIKNKILLALYIILILSTVDVIVSLIINNFITNINFKSQYKSIFSWLLQLLICFILLKSIKNFEKMSLNITIPNIFWLPLITIPIISILIILLLLLSKDIDIYLVIFLCILLTIINIMLFILYDFLIQYIKQKIDKEILEKENQFNLKQLNIIKTNYEILEEFRHDFKNHIIHINRCAMNNNLNEIIKYTNNLLDKTKINDEFNVNTGNLVIDSLLSFKFQEILKNNIKLKYDIKIPYDLNINSVDLICILGNLIDNIIEANLMLDNIKDRYANINIKYVQKNLLINLENSFKEVKFDINKNLKTIKKDKAKHGFGLKNIKKIVDKYNGNMEMDIRENKFITQIGLILKK